MSILFLGVASSISIAAAAAAAATLPTITDLFCRGWSANTIKVVPQNAILHLEKAILIIHSGLLLLLLLLLLHPC
jgi:hypothetical protein